MSSKHPKHIYLFLRAKALVPLCSVNLIFYHLWQFVSKYECISLQHYRIHMDIGNSKNFLVSYGTNLKSHIMLC